MSRLTDRKIEDLLRQGSSPEPPPELLEKLRRDLPDLVESPAVPAASGRRLAGHRWALAASILIAVGGAFLGHRVLEESPADPMAPPEIALQSTVPESDTAPSQLKRRQTEAKETDLLRTEVLSEGGAERTVIRIEPPQAPAESPASQDHDLGRLQKKIKPVASTRHDSAAKAPRPSEARTTNLPTDSVTFSVGSPPVEPSPARKVQAEPPALDQAARSVSEMVFEEELTVITTSPLLDARKLTMGSSIKAEESSGQRQAVASKRRRANASPSPRTPSDQPYDQNYFHDYGASAFVDTEDDPRSTFGLDVDTASYTVVRRYLDDGHLPPPAAIRVEEMVNFFDYGDEAPAEGDFALYAEGAKSPFGTAENRWLLRLHLQGREVEARDRPPADLIFVVDVSGSMQRENRLELVKKALYLLLDELRPGDRVALVVYGSRGQVLLAPTGHLGSIRDGISELRPGGSTNVEEGLMLAYELASEYGRRGAIQRIILCSDGVANVGRTRAEGILPKVRRWAAEGIELTTVGFGMGNFNDVLMEQLADQGDGHYAYVDDLDEAHRVFVENLTGTLLTIASDARAQVELDPSVVQRYRLVGYENRDMADRDFRNDATDAGEIGAGHGVTAIYELELRRKPSRGQKVATLRLRYRSENTGEFEEDMLQVTGRAFSKPWQKASRALRLSTVVAEFGELLKGGRRARVGDLEDLFRRSQELSSEFASDHEVAELVSLIGRAARLRERETD